MSGFTSKSTGALLVMVGIMGVLAVITLLLFFMSFLPGLGFLSFMGSLNDSINCLVGILSGVLATTLHLALYRSGTRFSQIVLAGAWIGAAAIFYGSGLILTDQGDVERSSYFYFFGFGLIGIWCQMLNSVARRLIAWPGQFTSTGLVASTFMMFGLLALFGLLMGWDGSDYSPLVLVTGLSYVGIGFLYPIWCLRLGRWVLSQQKQFIPESSLDE